MNRKIKYLFFLVSFITVNMAILILVMLGCIALSELLLAKVFLVPLGLSYTLALFLGLLLSLLSYRFLYRYAQDKWYIDRIFDFSHRDHLDL